MVKKFLKTVYSGRRVWKIQRPFCELFFFNIENTYWIVLIPEIYLLISEVLEKEENRVPYSQNLALALVYIFVCFIPTSSRHK